MVDIYVGPENTHWILHEKLLCARSKFFNKIFYSLQGKSRTKQFGLPEEDDEPFKLFVGWLYSEAIPPPNKESDLGKLFDLYLMAEKWQVARLVRDVLDTVRAYYRNTQTYPSLRRVQYIYAETAADSPMRQLLVSAVARMLALGDNMPAHWDKALRKNGQLAVDIILATQTWRLLDEAVPDPREEMLAKEVEKFSLVEKAESSMTDAYAKSKAPKQASEAGSKASEMTDNDGDRTLVGSGDDR